MTREIIYWVVYCLTSIIEAYTISRYMELFLGESELPRQKLAMMYVLRNIICVIQYSLFPIVIVTSMCTFFTLMLISMAYKTKWTNRILTIGVIYISFVMAEAIVAIAINLEGVDMYYNGRLGNAIILVIVQIMLRIVYEVIRLFKNISKETIVPKSYALMNLLISIIIAIIEMKLIAGVDVPVDMKITIGLGVIMIYVMMIYLFDTLSKNFQEKMKLELAEREKEYYVREMKLLTEQSEELRRFRHDIKNHLLGLQYRFDSEGKTYIEALNNMIDDRNIYCQTGNTVLDGLINHKLAVLGCKGTKVSADIKVPQDIFIKDEDTVVLLGNLLDNAIEALEKVGSEKGLWLNIHVCSGLLKLQIRNTYSEPILSNGKGIKTSKKDSLNHGIGLINVKTIVDKYNGNMDITYDNNEFCVDIIMYI